METSPGQAVTTTVTTVVDSLLLHKESNREAPSRRWELVPFRRSPPANRRSPSIETTSGHAVKLNTTTVSSRTSWTPYCVNSSPVACLSPCDRVRRRSTSPSDKLRQPYRGGAGTSSFVLACRVVWCVKPVRASTGTAAPSLSDRRQ
jgi:hypothetical protein